MSLDNRPLIGIPAGSYNSSYPGVKTYRFNGNYTAAVAAAGGLPVAVPLNLPDQALQAIFARFDGLLLAGGDDVDPAQYGQQPHDALGNLDPARDATEITLARWALAGGLPILAICRGIQVLNVAAGGTLYQHLPANVPGSLRHDHVVGETPWEQPTQCVRVLAGSRLADIVGAGELNVNSFHHQAVREVAGGFRPSAWAPDGVIEAIESPNAGFVLGIQWHPEAMTGVDEAARRIFAAFVAAAAASAGATASGAAAPAPSLPAGHERR